MIAKQLLSRERIQVKAFTKIGGPLERFYASREVYERLAGSAWDTFMSRGIVVDKFYPTARPGMSQRRVFSLPHSRITGLDRDRLLRITF